MPESHTYLITGANRGTGRGPVETFLARPHTTVIAAVRGPKGTESQSLPRLERPESSKLVIVKIDRLEKDDARTAIAHLESDHAISKIDVVIANAGIAKCLEPVLPTSAQEMRDHFNVNTVVPLVLFQASWPLLQAAEWPMFFGISSSIGGIAEMVPLPGLAYGASKAAVNYLARKLHFEHEGLVSVAVHPG